MEAPHRIDLSANVDAFFEEAVHEAVVSSQVEATRAAEQYLTLLLSGYARGEVAQRLDRPLTFLLHDALETRGADRFQRLQSLGDGVLYIMGFFGRGQPRRGADRGYVLSVGSSAYGHASAMLDLGGTDSDHNVLAELARKFDRFVDVLAEVADGAMAGQGDASILRLYERWQQTGSERLASLLGAAGLCPVKNTGGIH